jgi:hypothetical protein
LNRNLLAIGSTPVDGSSKKVISLPPIKAFETQSFLLFPPLNLPTYVLTKLSNCIVFIKYSIEASNFSIVKNRMFKDYFHLTL